MKKLIAALVAVAMMFTVAVADPAEPADRFSTYGATSDIGNIFPGKYFSIDLFMSYDLTAYITIQTWDEHDVSIMYKQAAIKSKASDPGVLYFVFPDETYYTMRYDDENRVRLWLTIDGVSIRMQYSEWLIPSSDVKGI